MSTFAVILLVLFLVLLPFTLIGLDQSMLQLARWNRGHNKFRFMYMYEPIYEPYQFGDGYLAQVYDQFPTTITFRHKHTKIVSTDSMVCQERDPNWFN